MGVDTPMEPVSPSQTANAPADAKRIKLLIVDDHPETARTLARLLTAVGYLVRTASTAAGALDHFAREQFDVVVSDIGLPDATGHDLMRRIAAHGAVRAVAMSGHGTEEDVRKSLAAGFREHLTKPIKVWELDSAVRRALVG